MYACAGVGGWPCDTDLNKLRYALPMLHVMFQNVFVCVPESVGVLVCV